MLVGKSDHHAVAVTAAGKTVHDKSLPNDEIGLRAILEELVTTHGPMLMVVDRPAMIGALPVAVAQTMDGAAVAYLPGLAMRRVVDLHPGSARIDARDAFSRLFARATGVGFNRTVTRIRLTEACRLLRGTDLPVSEICYRVGFTNLSNFNRHFRATTGTTPSRYRRIDQL